MVRLVCESVKGRLAGWTMAAFVAKGHKPLKTVWKLYGEKEDSGSRLLLVGSHGWEVWNMLSDTFMYSKVNSLNQTL